MTIDPKAPHVRTEQMTAIKVDGECLGAKGD